MSDHESRNSDDNDIESRSSTPNDSEAETNVSSFTKKVSDFSDEI